MVSRLVVLALLPLGLSAQSSIWNFLPVTGRDARSGTELLGQLEAGDATLPWGHRVQAWTFTGRAGERVRIDLRSSDFDAFLFVSGPGLDEDLIDDDGGDGLNSRICTVLPQNGSYRIVAASLGGQTGRYSLLITPDASGTCGEDATATSGDVSDVTALSTDGRVLAMDRPMAGALSAHGTTFSGRPVLAYGLELRQGQSVTLDLASDAFDSFLFVLGPGLSEPLSDDDGAGGCNARVTFTAPESGLYRAIVTGLGTPNGSFTITAYRQAPPASDAPCIPSSNRATADGDPATVAPTGTLALGRPSSGRLSRSEPQWSGRPVQVWTVQGRAGQRVRIDVESDEFDTYLGLMGPGYESTLTNDDGGDGLNSRLCLDLPESGTYRVLAAAFGSSGSGTYTVSALEESCEPLTLSAAQRDRQFATMTVTGQLAAEREMEGTMQGDEPQHPDRGTPVQVWTMQGRANQTLTIDMISTAFDPYLFVSGPGLERLFDDDSGGCRNARVTVTFPQNGTYQVLATAFSGSASGQYRLIATANPGPARPCESEAGTVETVDGGEVERLLVARERVIPRPVLTVPSSVDRNVALIAGAEITSTLTGTDATFGAGRHAQAWGVDLRAGDHVTVDLVSDAFDPYLFVAGPGIDGAYGDDDGGGGLASRIVFTAPGDGMYRLIATGLRASATGVFTLRIVRRVSGN